MTNTFGPVDSHTSKDKAILDGILISIGVATAPIWNKCTSA